MRGAIQITRLFKIPVFVHWSFFLIFIWVGYVGYSEGLTTSGIAWLMFTTVLLFVCVIMHEFGHSLAARRYGVNTKDIILLPIGGVARLEIIPEVPKQEFVIAIAGPLVNIGIAIITGIYVFASGSWERIIGSDSIEDMLNPTGIILILFVMNITLFLFNLIPAFPMDGGRILRSLLSLKWERERATKWAANIGQMIAILFFAYGISNGHYGLIFIGIFIFFSANSEYQALLRKLKPVIKLEDVHVEKLCRKSFSKLYLWDSMSDVFEHFYRGQEDCFLVYNAFGELEGTIDRNAIMRALLNDDGDKPVRDFYNPKLAYLAFNDTLDDAIKKFTLGSYHILPVLEEDAVVGVLDHKGIDNAMHIQQSKINFAQKKLKKDKK